MAIKNEGYLDHVASSSIAISLKRVVAVTTTTEEQYSSHGNSHVIECASVASKDGTLVHRAVASTSRSCIGGEQSFRDGMSVPSSSLPTHRRFVSTSKRQARLGTCESGSNVKSRSSHKGVFAA